MWPSTDELMKMWHVCNMEFYLVVEKNDIVKFAGKWMQLDYYFEKGNTSYFEQGNTYECCLFYLMYRS